MSTATSVDRYEIEAFNQPLVRRCEPLPDLRGTEVLVKVDMCGICHSDLHIWHGPRPGAAPRPLPLTMGHEIVGTVQACGVEADRSMIGTKVIVFPWIGCGKCTECTAGREVQCASPNTIGIVEPGGFASHVVVPHPRYLVNPSTIPLDVAATLACSGLTAFSAIRKLPDLSDDDTLMIVGAGGVGLAAVGLAKALSRAKVAVVDISCEKLDLALDQGADQVFTPDELRQSPLFQAGCRAAIDFVGSPATVSTAVASIRKGGALVMVGLQGGDMPLKIETLIYKNLSLLGSLTGTLAEMRELVALFAEGGVKPVPVARRPMAQINDLLSELERGNVVGRVVASNA